MTARLLGEPYEQFIESQIPVWRAIHKIAFGPVLLQLLTHMLDKFRDHFIRNREQFFSSQEKRQRDPLEKGEATFVKRRKYGNKRPPLVITKTESATMLMKDLWLESQYSSDDKSTESDLDLDFA